MAKPRHALIVEAPYYQEISDELAAGAIEALTEAGASYERLAVPGALEIPGAIALAAGAREGALPRFDCFVALGCVIRGETSHYDYVCSESARGLMDLSIRDKLCLGNGILTVENRDQAMARADRKRKNKGRDAAMAALAMAGIKEKFS